jgi:rifampicin phosphotransferase
MKYVWDNSNIVESYPGICSPLTFSFARYIYREVYLQTAPLFGVEPEVITRLYRKLETFLGYIDGRFYYNLETWCSLVSYLPGFSENPRLLQEMMGVKPQDRIEIPRAQVSRLAKLKLLARFIYYHFVLEGVTSRWITRFEQDFRDTLHELEPLHDPHEIMRFFFEIENRYLRHWQIPILNDFSVMIYSGLLRRTSRRYLHRDLDPKQITDIGETGNTRMIEEIRRLAQAVKRDPLLLPQFQTLEPAALWERLKADPAMGSHVQQFLSRFGLRNGHNLKLETPNLKEEPNFFVELLRQYVLAEGVERARALPRDGDQLPGSIPRLQELVLNFLIRHTKCSLRRREEMRDKRSQIFGVVREIFLKIGAGLAGQDVITQPGDIFYLEMDEVFGLLQGTSTLKDVRVLVQQRQKELTACAEYFIPSHFATNGIPIRDSGRLTVQGPGEPPDELTGSPNYPAVVTGEVVVMERPDFSQDVRDKILVCRQTDPSWVPFLGLVKGIIVERGGMLSHAAIVCRELKVPSVIGVKHATEILRSGQRVQLDSAEGRVIVL